MMRTERIPKLLKRFAIPAVIANLISALYNIVDQIFIGQGVGYLGNAATNIAFPITTISLAIALMLGIGAASNFNLEMGRGNPEKVKKMVGTTYGLLLIIGLIFTLILLLFTEPIIITFGATGDILHYASTFVRITALSLPFFFISIACNAIVRADGSANYSMMGMVTGAILNMILNPIFIFHLHWGIAGSAWATVISQTVSGLIFLAYIPKFKNISLTARDLIPNVTLLKPICALGLGPMFNQFSVTIIQITTNNLLRIYGAQETIGSSIPIAVVGVVTKLNQIYIAIVMGISQGAQPIQGFNYGARAYGRVREIYSLTVKLVTLISISFFLIFQCFTEPIISLFGTSSQAYMDYATRYLHIFAAVLFVNGFQIATGLFFSAIGKAKKSAVLVLTKQIVLILPLLVLMTVVFGVANIMIANPIADFLSAVVAVYFIYREFQSMPKEDRPFETEIVSG
ncbi:MATE family efflux transporter [Streptococcus tangpeifui]|nr:MATE family efflux transporter [Streptococcus sp. ZJ373]